MKKFLFALTILFSVLFFMKADSFAYDVSYHGRTFHFSDSSSYTYVHALDSNRIYIVSDASFSYTYFFNTYYVDSRTGSGIYYFLLGHMDQLVEDLPSPLVTVNNLNDFVFAQPEFDDSLDIFGFRVRKITGKLDLTNDGQTSLVSPWCMAWWDSVSENVDHVVMTFYNTDTGDVVINPATNYFSFLLGTYISGGAMTVGVTPYDSAGNYGYTSYAEVGYLFQSVDDPIGYETDYTLDGEPVDVIGKDPQVVYKTTFVPTSGSPSGGTVIYEGDTYIYKTPPASDPSPDNPNPTPPTPSTGAPILPTPSGYKFDWPDASDKDKVFKGVKDFFSGFGDGFGSIVSLLLLIFPMLGPVGAVLIFCMGLVLVFGAIIILIKIIGTIL